MAALTENSTDNFWLDLINWSNEEDDTPTRRWNLFQTWLLQNDDVGLSAQERSKKNAAFLHGLGIVANEFNKFRGFFNNYANLIDECQQKINQKRNTGSLLTCIGRSHMGVFNDWAKL